MKKILCVLLVVLMCLTAAPLGGFAELDFGMTASALNATGKCDTCNYEIVVIEPETPDEPTEEAPEEKPCTCDCHAGGIKAFFFKLLNFFAKIFSKDARVCECGKAH